MREDGYQRALESCVSRRLLVYLDHICGGILYPNPSSYQHQPLHPPHIDVGRRPYEIPPDANFELGAEDLVLRPPEPCCGGIGGGLLNSELEVGLMGRLVFVG